MIFFCMYRIAVQTMDIFACFESIDELGRPLHGAKYRNIISNNIKKTADNALSQANAGGDGCLRLGMAWNLNQTRSQCGLRCQRGVTVSLSQLSKIFLLTMIIHLSSDHFTDFIQHFPTNKFSYKKLRVGILSGLEVHNIWFR